jgi:hypothetical protein
LAGEKSWNFPTKATQIDCILFNRAAENFAIVIKSSAARAKDFGAANKSSVFCSTVREIFWNLPTKATQINRISFSRSESFWNLQTETTQINCIFDFGIDCVLCTAQPKKNSN